MEAKKNLCAMIPAALHNRLRQEQEQLGLTLSAYVEKLINEHFEGGKTAMTEGTRTLALQIPEELYQRLKDHLRRTGLTQKKFIISLVEEALREEEG